VWHISSIITKIVTDFRRIFRDFIFLFVKKCLNVWRLGTHLMIQVLQFLGEEVFLYPNSAPKSVFIYKLKINMH